MVRSMGKISHNLSIVLLLLLVNISIVLDLIYAILTKGNILIPIIILFIEIATIVIYRFIGQFGEKFGSMDHNPNY